MSYEKEMLWSLTFVPSNLYGLTGAEIEAAGNTAFWCNILDGPVNGQATAVTGTIPYDLKEQLRLGSQCSCLGTPSPTDNAFLVNFGGVINSPDANGNHWTNVEMKGTAYQLIDKAGVTRYDITTSGGFVKYTNPSGFANPDPTLLGDMAIPDATISYMYLTTGTGVVTISCLDPDRQYRLSIFGSRNSTTSRETKYTVTGAGSTSGILQTSGSGIATNATLNCNDDEFLVLDAFPSAEGIIEISVVTYSGGFGYLNMLKIEEVADPSVVPVTGISINTSNLSTSGSSQLTIDYFPGNTTQTGVNWTVDDESIAIIDDEGNLKPKQAGTVTITATSSFDNSLTDQVQVTFANLITELYFTGLATESGSDMAADGLAMRQVMDAEGTLTNQFEMYTSMSATGNYCFFTTTDGSGTEFGGDGSGNLIEGAGHGIVSPGGGWKYVFVDLNEMTYSVTPMYGWNVVSHMLPKEPGQESWWGGIKNLSTYQGNGVWSGTVNFSVPTRADDSPRFYIELAGTGRAIKQIKSTKNSLIFVDKANGMAYTDIYNFLGDYTITVDMQNFNYDISKNCNSMNETKISVMGSSVAKGYGASIATDDFSQYMGYAHQYDLLLRERANNGTGENWLFSNISVGGNTTVDLLNRFNYHLLSDCGKYVVFGLSLANEGVLSNGQVAFDQFSANMQTLIQQARDNGKVPVVMGNYANGYYNDAHYQLIKDMNLLIHQWDVPSVNLLGTVDNGTGNWIDGYWTDPSHPNDAGYTEMMYAIVPSLFDALHAAKPQPQLVADTWMKLGSQVGRKLVLTPEEVVHSFTVSVGFRTNGNGTILNLSQDSGAGVVAIDQSTGAVVYHSPNSGQIVGTTVVNDGAWHSVTLTHYYAREETLLYIDGVEQGNLLNEPLLVSLLSLNSETAPLIMDCKDWLFYRSAMNGDEISALHDGKLLKSSLEVYAPLDGQGVSGHTALVNLAQSTNVVTEELFSSTAINVVRSTDIFQISPNPIDDQSVCYYSMSSAGRLEISIYNLIGQKVGMVIKTHQAAGNYQLSFCELVDLPLPRGMYLGNLKTKSDEKTIKLVVD